MAPYEFGRARAHPHGAPNGATQNSYTRALSPPRVNDSNKMRMARLGHRDDAYVAMQRDAGMRWTQRSGFNPEQVRDFRMLLDLISPIMIKPDRVQGAREIAKGSFGTIYKASYNNREVAVKRINKDAAKPLAAKMREAYLELNVMNDLSHPNVIQLIGVSAQFSGTNPESFYFGIVLELCSDSLQNCLRKARLPFGVRMGMALELVNGVSYVHSMGVFHRDLSSQNILVTAEQRVKIADFGCARKIDHCGEYKTTSITGSPAYMPPEQLEGHVLTLKADVWAVGVNLWELATQKLPWADEAMRESPTRIADYQYCRQKLRTGAKMVRPALGQLNTSVADSYYDLIMWSHRTDPKMRPSSKDLLAKLKLVLSKSSDEKVREALECTTDVQNFLADPDCSAIVGGRSAEEMLKLTLFKFYTMYNPDRLYAVPKLAKRYAQDQHRLNSDLRKRYGTDLSAFSDKPAFAASNNGNGAMETWGHDEDVHLNTHPQHMYVKGPDEDVYLKPQMYAKPQLSRMYPQDQQNLNDNLGKGQGVDVKGRVQSDYSAFAPASNGIEALMTWVVDGKADARGPDFQAAPEIPKVSVWKEVMDEYSGTVYYWNTLTDETSWNLPPDAVLDQPSDDYVDFGEPTGNSAHSSESSDYMFMPELEATPKAMEVDSLTRFQSFIYHDLLAGCHSQLKAEPNQAKWTGWDVHRANIIRSC